VETHYQTLGVAFDDPHEKIKARYRLLALDVHPDTGNANRVDEFTRFTTAYRTLSHPRRRQHYNEELGIFIKPRGLHPGHNLYQRIEISCEIAERGGVVPLAFVRYEPCSLCWLSGCHRCQFQGMVPEQVDIQVKVTPNSPNGTTIFVEGQGGCSEPSGPRGDLFVYVVIQSGGKR
jgi:DnaJ-class molecular chaperone